jgi:polysaccharide export outer membrane protein
LKGITSDPQVQITLTSDLSGSVLVAGAVKNPGRFSSLQGPLTLLDAINQAGGPLLEPHLIRVVVRTGKKSYQYNYQDLLSGKNQVVPPGAEIVLERARKRFVAMGAVGDPGLHDLPSNNPSLLEVLGSVKGLNEVKADAAGVFVFRLIDRKDPASGEIKPRAEVFRLNLKEPAAMFLARQFLVLPEDAIYVTNAAVYEWQKIISPIVQVLVLGRTIEAL